MRSMKVILDANIIISYLLTPRENSTITTVIERCFSDEITLIMPDELVCEIQEKHKEKPYLNRHISSKKLDAVLQQIRDVAIIPDPLEEILPIGTDPDDDYLIAYGLIEEADYLITGDYHILLIKQFKNLKIVDPVEFLAITNK